jgi:hypothetical protein
MFSSNGLNKSFAATQHRVKARKFVQPSLHRRSVLACI